MTQPRAVGSRYELGELLGYGGMAEVHRGWDTRLNRDVAVKVLRADLARDPSFLTRFRREAHSAAGLNHPSIVAVYDTGEDLGPDGTPLPFIVMEYVDGRTLRDILKAEGPLPEVRAMQITAEICAALDFSHRNGIIHRDIKPANVMITPNGAVKVMDFGIARAVADTSATVTQTANVIGTAQYLSPEQARGESVDARSDVYSTGCLLYELVTGVPPFQGDSPVAVAYQHVRENPMVPSSRNPQLTPAVDSIVMKALAKNAYNRYQTAGEMRGDLQRAVAGQAVTAEAIMSDAERTQFIARTPPPLIGASHRAAEPEEERGSRRAGLIWAAVVLALLVVIGVGAYAIVFLGGDKGEQKVAVPSIIGQSPAAAIAALKKANFNAINDGNTNGPCANSQTVNEGAVCTINPAVGAMANKDSDVHFRTYTPAVVSVPYVTSKSYADASKALYDAKLVAVKKSVNSAQPEGTVLGQDPEPYRTVAPKSQVVLQVSTGKIEMPDVKGKDLDEARQQLNKAGFTNIGPSDKQNTTDPKKDNEVADQDPSPGITYAPDQKITLTQYVYKPPAPTCTTPPKTPSSPPGLPTTPGVPTTPTAPTTPGGSSSSSSGGLPACDVPSSGSTTPR